MTVLRKDVEWETVVTETTVWVTDPPPPPEPEPEPPGPFNPPPPGRPPIQGNPDAVEPKWENMSAFKMYDDPNMKADAMKAARDYWLWINRGIGPDGAEVFR